MALFCAHKSRLEDQAVRPSAIWMMDQWFSIDYTSDASGTIMSYKGLEGYLNAKMLLGFHSTHTMSRYLSFGAWASRPELRVVVHDCLVEMATTAGRPSHSIRYVDQEPPKVCTDLHP